jgi:hypothetical protein
MMSETTEGVRKWFLKEVQKLRDSGTLASRGRILEFTGEFTGESKGSGL